MSETNENQVPQAQFRLPERGYKLRVKDGTKKPSKQNKPMFELDCELVDNPPVVLSDGTSKDVNGMEVRHWVSLVENPNGSNPMASDFMTACGLPAISNADLPNLDVGLVKGRTFWALVKTEDRDRKDDAGNVITHPVTGLPIKVFGRKITQVLQPNG